MRKTLITASPDPPDAAGAWLDLERLARVEVSSEEPGHPIEGALGRSGGQGWRSATPGRQTIRLIFDVLQDIQRIWLCFDETQFPRTQEFCLRWSPGESEPFREILRQQWTFSPPSTTREIENYAVHLHSVHALELEIEPDRSGLGQAPASLSRWRLQ